STHSPQASLLSSHEPPDGGGSPTLAEQAAAPSARLAQPILSVRDSDEQNGLVPGLEKRWDMSIFSRRQERAVPSARACRVPGWRPEWGWRSVSFNPHRTHQAFAGRSERSPVCLNYCAPLTTGSPRDPSRQQGVQVAFGPQLTSPVRATRGPRPTAWKSAT